MEINPRFINLPPLLSLAWDQVASIHMEEELLVVTLVSGSSIELPNLPTEIIQRIFAAHCFYLRHTPARQVAQSSTPINSKEQQKSCSPSGDTVANGSEQIAEIRVGFTSLDGMGSALQHDPSMSQAPDIPQEILNKIAAVSKILAPDESDILAKAEPNCNCMYCQIIRTIQSELHKSHDKNEKPEIDEEQIVTDEELTFQEWDIKQDGEKLFSVISRSEPNKRYHVHLGEPIGCTCGDVGCDHIIAVLKS